MVENKRLGAVLAVIRDRQAETARKRNGAAQSRSFQQTTVPRLSAGARRCATPGAPRRAPPAAGDNSTLRAG